MMKTYCGVASLKLCELRVVHRVILNNSNVLDRHQGLIEKNQDPSFFWFLSLCPRDRTFTGMRLALAESAS
jgi:hypothetical protein